jgi:cysteinyl-tRNA synthetase
MQPIYLYHTYRKEKVELKPIHPPKVTMYTCGPTVYDKLTLGNWRAYIFSDLLHRTLKYLGYDVLKVMNYTDVGHIVADGDVGEDKMEKGAKKKGISIQELISEMIKYFEDNAKKMNILLNETTTCQATKHIQEMIEMIQELEKRGYVYVTPQAVYFDTQKFKEIEKYTQQSLDDMLKGAGGRVSEEKDSRHPADFRLWQLNQPDQIQQWDSPWGRGFPGWHIECSAMSMRYLSDAFSNHHFHPEKFQTIDIHTGGEDHIKLHHANEIAQSQCATNKPFANIWMHNYFMNVNGKRMGKSEGNAYTLEDVIDKGYDPMDMRFWYYMSHYRTKTNFTWEALDEAKGNRKYLNDTIQRLISNIQLPISNKTNEQPKQTSQFINQFEKIDSALTDDLNTPLGLSILYEICGELNTQLDKNELSETESILNQFKKLNEVLGFLILEKVEVNIPDEIKQLAEERIQAKQTKDFALADKLRQEITNRGYEIKDISGGYEIKCRT